jgi:hypothetical protein
MIKIVKIFAFIRFGISKLSHLILCCIILLATLLSTTHLSAQPAPGNNTLIKKAENIYLLKGMEINTEARSIKIPCTVNMNQGLIEVVLCGRKGKIHESLLTTQTTPVEFQTALLLLGADPVNEIPDSSNPDRTNSQFLSIETSGDSLRIYLLILRNDNEIIRPVENYIYDESKSGQLSQSSWLFRGAATHQSGHVLTDPEITLIATYHDPMALMELNAPTKFNDELYYVNKEAGLNIGESVFLILEMIKP